MTTSQHSVSQYLQKCSINPLRSGYHFFVMCRLNIVNSIVTSHFNSLPWKKRRVTIVLSRKTTSRPNKNNKIVVFELTYSYSGDIWHPSFCLSFSTVIRHIVFWAIHFRFAFRCQSRQTVTVFSQSKCVSDHLCSSVVFAPCVLTLFSGMCSKDESHSVRRYDVR